MHDLMESDIVLDNACNYPYQQLDSQQQEFRVLDVYPGTDAHVLKCSIRHIKHAPESVPPYETISYSLGEHTTYASLVIDDLPLAAHATAVSALVRVRLSKQIRTLWIDAICINQKDLDERAQQVTRMASIYRHVRGNLVYLGQDYPLLASAIDSIHKILTDARRHTNDLKNFWDAIIVDGNPNFSATSFDHDTKLAYAALDRVYSSAWFQYDSTPSNSIDC